MSDMRLLENAELGWRNYIYQGKFPALFLLALLYLAMVKRKRSEGIGTIGNYGAAMAVLCIFPPTAAILMWYQTPFYDYQWVWSLAPLTAVIAMGGTLLLTEQSRSGHSFNNVCYNIILTAAAAGVVLLSANAGADNWGKAAEAQQRAEAERTLAAVADEGGGEICLWAPRGIMEYARALDGGIILPYGRNMWDITLNAYCYDGSAEDLEILYLWMEKTAQTGAWDHETEPGEEAVKGSEQMAHALELGINRILLRDNLSEDSLGELKDIADENDLEIQKTEGYYLLKKR